MNSIAQEAATLDEAVELEKAATPAPAKSSGPHWLTRILTAEPGPGEVADYLDHPLNLTKTTWNARLLRGLTGMLGNLRLALVDIIMAGVEYIANRKTVAGGYDRPPGL